jgi:hypothetical protein
MRSRIYSLALLLALSAAPALGQGCAMCYTSARGASDGGQKALSRAVLTLLIPPVGMMAVLVGIAFRYRRNGRQEEESTPAALHEDGATRLAEDRD